MLQVSHQEGLAVSEAGQASTRLENIASIVVILLPFSSSSHTFLSVQALVFWAGLMSLYVFKNYYLKIDHHFFLFFGKTKPISCQLRHMYNNVSEPLLDGKTASGEVYATQ